MARVRRAAMLLSLLLFAGCSIASSYLDLARDSGVSREYLDVLNAWTRKKELYSQFETRAIIHATFKSHAFNRAYLSEYVRAYRVTEEEKKERQELASRGNANAREFVVYAAMADTEANDFDKVNSVWRIFLVDQRGKQIPPAEVRRLDTIPRMFQEFYPYVNQWHGICYTVSFPPPPEKAGSQQEGVPLQLVFTGVMGTVTLSWP